MDHFEDKDTTLTILNCCAVIGEGMKKGVIFDLLNNQPLRLSLKSKMQFITNTEIANAIFNIIKYNLWNLEVNIVSKGNIMIQDVCNLLEMTPITINNELRVYEYVCDIDKLYIEPKKAEHYIREILK